LASFIAKMLEKQRDKRFRSWEELLDELDKLETKDSPEGAQPKDPILARAIAAVEKDRAEKSEEQRRADEARAVRDGVVGVMQFWANEFFGAVSARVTQYNDALGQEAYELKVDESDSAHRLTLRFYQGTLNFDVYPAPIGNEMGAIGWGIVHVKTPTRLWVCNLLLVPSDDPYGVWHQIDMKVSGIVRPGARPENRRGGAYDILGGERLVLATSWEFLLEQWEYRTTMSVVDYRDVVLDLEAVLSEVLATLTDYGNVAAPPPPPENRGRRGGVFDRGFPDV
jgi:hypothetical protein